MSEKRDIQADRVMIEKHLGWAETGSWARYFADIASHYLTRTEEAESALAHERRKVEAAVDELVRQRPCPPRIPCPPDAHPFETEREQCMKCWSDYLNQRAKEGEGK